MSRLLPATWDQCVNVFLLEGKVVRTLKWPLQMAACCSRSFSDSFWSYAPTGTVTASSFSILLALPQLLTDFFCQLTIFAFVYRICHGSWEICNLNRFRPIGLELKILSLLHSFAFTAIVKWAPGCNWFFYPAQKLSWKFTYCLFNKSLFPFSAIYGTDRWLSMKMRRHSTLCARNNTVYEW